LQTNLARQQEQQKARQSMLKVYDKLDDVPEALREHYKLIDGKYVAELSDDHPIKLNNVKLLNEKTTAETKAAGLETANTSLKADLESAKSHSLPRGHRAVPVADIEAMDKLKEHGSATDIVAKLTEHATLKAESDKRAVEDSRAAVAKALGYTNVEAFKRLPGLPEFEIRGEGERQTVIAKVKDGDKVVEKSAKEFIESSPDIAPFLPALTVKEGVVVHGGGGQQQQAGDPFAAAREFAKKINEAQQAPSTIHERFGMAKSAA
jgi:hypothetical protein